MQSPLPFVMLCDIYLRQGGHYTLLNVLVIKSLRLKLGMLYQPISTIIIYGLAALDSLLWSLDRFL